MARRARSISLFAAVLLTITGAVQGQSIFVDDSSPSQSPDGSASAPFKTITKALERAREIRFGSPAHPAPSNATINVQVAAGEYKGAFATTNKPLEETLPIVLNIPRLNLKGATRLDAAGRVVPGTQTLLHALEPQSLKQHLLVVTRTVPAGSQSPVSAGDSVTISGFVFDGTADNHKRPDISLESALVSLDGVSDFAVSGNVFTHAGTFGITSRLSSGLIQNNQFIENQGVGINISGGSEKFPAVIEIVGNRLKDNGAPAVPATPTVPGKNGKGGGIGLQGAAQTEEDSPTLFDAHPFRRARSDDDLPAFYDRVNHPELVPDKLDVSLVRNEVSGGGPFGIHVHGYLRDNYKLAQLDPSDMNAQVRARFVQNSSKSSNNYGVVIDAGQIQTLDHPRKHVIKLDVSFRSTTLEANKSGEAFFGFSRFSTSLSAVEESSTRFKVAHDSTITICGDVKRFNFDNRAADPLNQTPTNNVLTVNNTLLERFCVPLHEACIFELPKGAQNCN